MAEHRQTTKIAMIVVLAAVLIGVLAVQTGVLPIGSRGAAGTPPEGDKTGPSAAGGGQGVASAGQQVRWTRPEPMGPVINDPMRMALSVPKPGPVEAIATPEAEPEFRVAGIIFSTEQPSSIIIDGRILHEGDTIHGATVAKITETYAELWRGDKKWQIRAGQSNKEPK